MTSALTDFPSGGTDFEKLSALVQVARLAPSAHNAQPWACRAIDGGLYVERDDAHALKAGDPTRRETILSLAMFVETFVIAARAHGLAVEVDAPAVVPNDATLAVLRVRETSQPSDDALYDAICKRHTNRGPYLDMAVPDWLHEFALGVESEARTFIITEPDARKRIGALVSTGMTTALRLTTMREELAGLTYWNSEGAQRGMALEALFPGATNTGLSARDWFLSNANPHEEGTRIGAMFAATPIVLVIATRADDPVAWLDAGRVACRLLLRAAREDLTHDISAAPVEIPTLAPLLAMEIEPGWRPQMLIRVGRPQDPSLTLPSVRRSVIVGQV